MELQLTTKNIHELITEGVGAVETAFASARQKIKDGESVVVQSTRITTLKEWAEAEGDIRRQLDDYWSKQAQPKSAPSTFDEGE